MDTISFDRLLLKTAFCCMASDGHIDKREIALIKSMCAESNLFSNFNIHEEINILVNKINANGIIFLQQYFDLLSNSILSEEEELLLIEFAIKVIKADNQVEYSEIKFFKNIRHRLKVNNEIILSKFPDIEIYLEEDILTDGFLEKITAQYFQSAELIQFDLIANINNTIDKD